MKALTWYGKRDVRVEQVPDPGIREPDDVIVRVTSSGVCGSDLHLYEVMTPYLEEGDVLGHESLGVVEEVGPRVSEVAAGDRVVVPFNISCGRCWMCSQASSQASTRSARRRGSASTAPEPRSSATRSCTARCPAARRSSSASRSATRCRSRCRRARRTTASSSSRTCCPPPGRASSTRTSRRAGRCSCSGWARIGEMATRIAQHRGLRVLAVDLVPERIERARSHGVEVFDLRDFSGPPRGAKRLVGKEHEDDLVETVRAATDGRGPDSVIDAVGMEAHGAPVAKLVQQAAGLLPKTVQEKVIENAGVDRLYALRLAIELVRRGGTISILGVYGGAADPVPLRTLFDKQVQIRMGQANVLRWVPEIMPLLLDGDPLGTDSFASHHVPLDEAPSAYEKFQKKQDGYFKVVLQP